MPGSADRRFKSRLALIRTIRILVFSSKIFNLTRREKSTIKYKTAFHSLTPDEQFWLHDLVIIVNQPYRFYFFENITPEHGYVWDRRGPNPCDLWFFRVSCCRYVNFYSPLSRRSGSKHALQPVPCYLRLPENTNCIHDKWNKTHPLPINTFAHFPDVQRLCPITAIGSQNDHIP